MKLEYLLILLCSLVFLQCTSRINKEQCEESDDHASLLQFDTLMESVIGSNIVFKDPGNSLKIWSGSDSSFIQFASDNPIRLVSVLDTFKCHISQVSKLNLVNSRLYVCDLTMRNYQGEMTLLVSVKNETLKHHVAMPVWGAKESIHGSLSALHCIELPRSISQFETDTIYTGYSISMVHETFGLLQDSVRLKKDGVLFTQYPR